MDRYEEALARARQGMPMDEVFPELKESEDERMLCKLIDHLDWHSDTRLTHEECNELRSWLIKHKECFVDSSKTSASEDEGIRKALIWHLKAGEDFVSNGVTKEECLAYLEKQKEQKPILKFKVGDKIHLIDGTSPNYEDDCITIREIDTVNYIGEFKEGYVPIKEQDKWELVKEQKPVELERLEKPREMTKEIREAYERGIEVGKRLEQKPAEWSEGDEDMRKKAIEYIASYSDEYGDYNEIEKVLDWLKSLRPQPKQKWSEEDENYYDTIVRKLQVIGDDSGLTLNQIDFLDKHRPQPHWKPSEEQMERLISIIAALRKDYCDDMADFLASLYHVLEKLI